MKLMKVMWSEDGERKKRREKKYSLSIDQQQNQQHHQQQKPHTTTNSSSNDKNSYRQYTRTQPFTLLFESNESDFILTADACIRNVHAHNHNFRNRNTNQPCKILYSVCTQIVRLFRYVRFVRSFYRSRWWIHRIYRLHKHIHRIVWKWMYCSFLSRPTPKIIIISIWFDQIVCNIRTMFSLSYDFYGENDLTFDLNI